MRKLAKISIAILSLSAMSGAALAAKPGFYAGLGIGGSNLESAKRVIFPDAPEGTLNQSYNRNGLAGRGFVGYNFNEYVGIEGGATKYGDATYKSTSKIPEDDFKANASYNLAALNLVGKGYLPFGQSGFSLYALAGVAYVKSTFNYKDTLAGETINDEKITTKKLRPTYGVGASYDIPDSNVVANVEFSRIQGIGNINTSASAIPNANLATFNLAYNFG